MERKFEIPSPILAIIRRLNENGYEAYLVGGCIRDFLLGKKPHDYDIATNATPSEVQNLFEHSVPTGLQHGTVLVIEDGMEAEVTTFRKEGDYQDHRRPDTVCFVDAIEEDLRRRDFTINAMAYHPQKGLIDLFGGQKDLQAGIIKTVGDPAKRFSEDALRMIRAWRFAAVLGFCLDPETEKAIHQLEPSITYVSAERVRDELDKILMSGHPDVLDKMTILLQKWIPELGVMKQTEQNSIHHYTDVLHHTIDALKNRPKNSDLTVAWALLLHDTGKPAVKTTDEKGDHFKKHPFESEKIARRVCKDLKMPRKWQKEIPVLVLLHDSFYAPKLSNVYKLRIQKGLDDDLVEKLFQVQTGDILAHTTFERMEQLDAFRSFYHEAIKNRPLSKQQLAIGGNEILKHTSLQGPQIQQALDALLEKAFYYPELNTKEKLIEQLPAIEKDIVAHVK